MLHQSDIPILLIDADYCGAEQTTENLVGFSNGQSAAGCAVENATNLGIPEGLTIFADIEGTANVDADWLRGYYEGVTATGYSVGFYADGDGNFQQPFCSAVSVNSAMASAPIWANQDQTGRTTRANHPDFSGAQVPSCSTQGALVTLQYGSPASDSENGANFPADPNLDTNIMYSSFVEFLW